MSNSPIPSRGVALLAIDLQNEYRHDGAYPIEAYDDILGKVATLMGTSRRAGVPVIHVQAWVEPDERHRYALLEECLTDDLRSAVAGSVAAEICAEVAPVEGERVVRKRWPSAFRDTGLAEQLKDAGIEHLVTTGVWTDSCVRASVFDAVFAGFHVWLVKDACGSVTETMHRTAILDMANRLYGGGVLHTAEALKALRSEPHDAWRCSRPIELPYTLANLDRLYDAL